MIELRHIGFALIGLILIVVLRDAWKRRRHERLWRERQALMQNSQYQPRDSQQWAKPKRGKS